MHMPHSTLLLTAHLGAVEVHLVLIHLILGRIVREGVLVRVRGRVRVRVRVRVRSISSSGASCEKGSLPQ